jgi:hypothetical protein
VTRLVTVIIGLFWPLVSCDVLLSVSSEDLERPYIADVVPADVISGDVLRIVGSGFGEAESQEARVLFAPGLDPNDYPAEIIAWSNEEILVRVPDCVSGAIHVYRSTDPTDVAIFSGVRVFCKMAGHWREFAGWMVDPDDPGYYLGYAIDTEGRLHSFSGGITEPTFVDEGPWRQLAVGTWHACGIKEDGTLWCWGDGTGGRTTMQAESSTPYQVGAHQDWTDVAVIDYASCALRNEGRLYCWGGNADYGVGVSRDRSLEIWSPFQVDTSVRLQRLRGYVMRFCGIAVTGDLACWGRLKIERIASRPVLFHDPNVAWFDFDPMITIRYGLGCGIAMSDQSIWCDSGIGMPIEFSPFNEAHEWVTIYVSEADYGSPSLYPGTCGIVEPGDWYCKYRNETRRIQLGEGEVWSDIHVSRFIRGVSVPVIPRTRSLISCALREDGRLFCEFGTVDLGVPDHLERGEPYDETYDRIVDLAEGAE